MENQIKVGDLVHVKHKPEPQMIVESIFKGNATCIPKEGKYLTKTILNVEVLVKVKTN